jgi:hypothetical protein
MEIFTLRNLIVLIVVICVVYFIYDYFNSVEWSSRSTKEYGSYAPADRYPELLSEFGQPDMIDRSAGGGAIWFEGVLRSRNKPWKMIMILDEAIPHDKPAKHADFLYSWLRVDIPSEALMHDILRISESISYDPLKKWLQVRCHFMGANLATAVLVIRMVQGRTTLKQVQDDDLYAKLIFRTVKDHTLYDKNALSEYESEIRQYLNMR